MPRLLSSEAAWIWWLAKSMPFYKHLGMSLTKLDWGMSEMKVRVKRGLTQDSGFAHGGVAASLIDSTIGLALCTMLPAHELITTIELNVNFIAPASRGILRARGRIIHKGKRIAVGDAEIRNEKRRLIAKGTATYMILEDGQRSLRRHVA